MNQTIVRLQAASRWLQAGADVRSRREAETRDKECLGLAKTLERELNSLQNTMPGVSVCAAVGRSPRLRELVAIYSASVHLLEQPAKIDRRPGKAVLCLAVAKWVNHVLSKVPARAPPTNLQLAVADALLRARLLQGLSRQLAGLEDTVAAAAQGSGGQLVQPRTAAAEHSAVALHVLFEVVASTVSTMGALTDLGFDDTPLRHSQGCAQSQVPCGGAPAVGAASVADGNAGGRGNARAQVQGPKAEGQRAQEEEEERGAVLGGNSKQQQEQQQEQQQGQQQQQGQGQGQGGCPQPAARLTAATLFPEVLTAMADSGVLEHLSRGVLLLAGWLQHPKQQQQQQQHELLRVLQRACVHVTALHRSLSTFTNSPDLLDGTGSVHAASGGQAAAPEDRPPCLPPLEAERHVLKAAHVSLLRRVLLGPCARQLVLCMGLCALAELDGGSTYGVPEAAGLRHVSVAAADREPSGLSEVRQAAAVVNLLTLLAMRTDNPGSGAGAGPGEGAAPGATEAPGRGTRLQMTLRVARATAVYGTSRGRVGGCSGDSHDAGYFFLTVAVQALQFAWRHMPPPQGLGQGRGRGWRRYGCRHRRAALRQWAAVAEAVACSKVAAAVHSKEHEDDNNYGEVRYRLGLLLGLHPSAVGPVERRGGWWLWWWWALGWAYVGRSWAVRGRAAQHANVPLSLRFAPAPTGRTTCIAAPSNAQVHRSVASGWMSSLCYPCTTSLPV